MKLIIFLSNLKKSCVDFLTWFFQLKQEYRMTSLFERKKKDDPQLHGPTYPSALLPNLRAGYIGHIFTANRKPKFYMNTSTELHCLIYHMASTGEACMKRIKPFPAEHMQDCSHESACYTVSLCFILRDSTKSVVEICYIQGNQGTTFGPLYSPLCTTKSSGG